MWKKVLLVALVMAAVIAITTMTADASWYRFR